MKFSSANNNEKHLVISKLLPLPFDENLESFNSSSDQYFWKRDANTVTFTPEDIQLCSNSNLIVMRE